MGSSPDIGIDFDILFPELCYYEYYLFPKPFPITMHRCKRKSSLMPFSFPSPYEVSLSFSLRFIQKTINE